MKLGINSIAIWLSFVGALPAQVPKGPPPRFVIFQKVDLRKGIASFAAPVPLETVSAQVHSFSSRDVFTRDALIDDVSAHDKPVYVNALWTVHLTSTRWYDVHDNHIDSDAVWKQLKAGDPVVLSSDGSPVDRVFLRALAQGALVLVVAPKDLPIAYLPHRK